MVIDTGALSLGEAQKYAEEIVDTIRECLVVLDRGGRVRSANRAFLQMFKVTGKELAGRSFYEVGRGQWNSPALRKRLKALGPGERFEGYRLEREVEGAGRRVFSLNARRIEETPLILLAIEDVTEKERAEQALRQSERGFREMLATAGEAIIMADGGGRIVFANQRAQEIFGYAAHEMLGLPIETLVPERLRERQVRHRASYVAAPSIRTMGRDRELVGRRKDGTEVAIEVIISAMERDSGPLVVSFVTDLSLRKESEKKLRDYQDKLKQMAFDTALTEERERRRIAAEVHDQIGQSLALTQIKLTSMRETVTDAARATFDEAVDLLAQSIADTRTLIFDLSPPVLYDLGLREALSWLVEEFQKRHGIVTELADDGVDKPLDDATAALVFRGVRELLTNVFKHARSSSAKVSLWRTGDHIDIDVEDRGAGFDPNDVRLRSSAGGFGLFSVREQISRLGGTVEVTSAPGRGTHVSMRVPLKADTPSKRRAQEETS